MITLDDDEHKIILNCVKQLAESKKDDVLGLFLRYSISENIDEQKLIDLTFKLTGEYPPIMEH